jgi:hypothetical protein
MKYWFPLIQGRSAASCCTRSCCRAPTTCSCKAARCTDVAAQGIALDKMTPVPMAVDTELARLDLVAPSDDQRLQGRRVVAYLGTMDPVRRIDLLFAMMQRVRERMPDALLVLAGDTEDLQHRAWLQQEIVRLGLEQHVLWLGWQPGAAAWRYVRAAEIGLSLIPVAARRALADQGGGVHGARPAGGGQRQSRPAASGGRQRRRVVRAAGRPGLADAVLTLPTWRRRAPWASAAAPMWRASATTRKWRTWWPASISSCWARRRFRGGLMRRLLLARLPWPAALASAAERWLPLRTCR